MPFKSIKQERWAHTPDGMEALGGPARVAEWDRASKGRKLPLQVKKPLTGGLLGKLKKPKNY